MEKNPSQKNSIYQQYEEKVYQQYEEKVNVLADEIRQCGKTFSVLDFARKNYGNIVYLDFFLNPQYKSIFDDSLEIDNILVNISTLLPNVRIVPDDKTDSQTFSC